MTPQSVGGTIAALGVARAAHAIASATAVAQARGMARMCTRRRLMLPEGSAGTRRQSRYAHLCANGSGGVAMQTAGRRPLLVSKGAGPGLHRGLLAARVELFTRASGQRSAGRELRYAQTLLEIGTDQNSTIVFRLPLDLIAPFLARGAAERRGAAGT